MRRNSRSHAHMKKSIGGIGEIEIGIRGVDDVDDEVDVDVVPACTHICVGLTISCCDIDRFRTDNTKSGSSKNSASE